MNRFEKQIVIVNKLGLHARAATELVKVANQFDAVVTLVQGEKSASANSVLGLMMLESSQGKEVNVISEGVDAEHALAAIEKLIVEKFHENE
ncbi:MULTISPECIES: HPr family phosphocarrier protein [Alteromonadaceae]|uniref:HPr family phosphocarrier protein n=1 Tax=Alteromonadaceae TaxID=72275 RepID=UPI001C097EF2|nr:MULTISPECIES: HPr family phosphocarrier protein [Aliiglaciecola]MBU2879447.1 HPr family phosphocarrier protein [Aliiglaciecola lipolytica]MDO6712489.1 HPr family phosphocarrier protein [Aliiglaciecola sp. 2_MG-2023]MDO6753453.1 HPr family phosphocarrier protein [Aliiglaciecola sp. 1_MG-2023]